LEGEATILALVHEDKRVERLEEGQSGVIVLDRTPFYAESGGQIGDRGTLTDDAGAVLFQVEDTQKTAAGYVLHFGEAAEPLAAGQTLRAQVDAERRRDTRANHSSVHLLQAALRRVAGAHVTQQGSFVGPEGMRFDFTQPEPLGDAALREIETLVNEWIRADWPVRTQEMTLEEARQTGAIAPFGEKYGARVRVLSMGPEGQEPLSTEFCGGTHAARTGQLGQFVVVAESSVASGIRRIEGKAGRAAYEHTAHERRMLQGLARRLSSPPETLEERISALQEEIKILRRQAEEARAAQARVSMAQAAEAAREVAGLRLIVQRMDGAQPAMLAQAWDALKQKSPAATVGVFASVADGKVGLLVGATDDVAPARIKAGDILAELAARLGGKGGGKPNLARGGGNDPAALQATLDALPGIVERLAK
jgi:alanyl-tRNA synthetase